MRFIVNRLPAGQDRVDMSAALKIEVESKQQGILGKVLPEAVFKGRPLVRIDISANTTFSQQVVFSTTLKVAKTFEEVMNESDPKSDTQKKIASHEYIPLTINSSGPKASIKPQEIVYIKISDLAKLLGIEPAKLGMITGRLTAGDTTQSAVCISAFLSDKLKLAEEREFSTNSLKTKWNQPVSPEITTQANHAVASMTRLNAKQLHDIGRNEKFIQARTEGSNSIDKGKKGGENISAATARDISKKNWATADNFVRELATSGKPITAEDLCKINEILYKGLAVDVDVPEKVAGKYREHIVQVGGFNGIMYLHHSKVKDEMKDFVKWINSNVQACQKNGANPISIAAQAYQRMVSIHPFSDGNGRTCRLVMDYVLQTCGLPPAILGKNVDLAIFGIQEQDVSPRSKTPTEAVEVVLNGVKTSYTMMNN